MMIRKIYKYILVSALCFATVACEDFETMNQDPNNPVEVPPHMLMNGTQKWIMDNIYNVWFSGRQGLVYSQYWAQRTYTEEDRYQIRESVNNSSFDNLYQGIANLQKIVALNTDEQTKGSNARYGANCNQIAAATILKVWLMGIITDTWGSVPYTEVGKLKEGVLYCKYDEQKTIYETLIGELTAAVSEIDESKTAFVSGDVIYGGDAAKWKKFGNSLKCRLAVHLSKIDPNWKTYIAEAVADGVFTSNADAAAFKYSSSGLDFCKFYANYYVDGRNDFTISKTLTDILKGEVDVLNGKSHPWAGVVDPRLRMYTTSDGGAYNGMPYGVPIENTANLRPGTPNWSIAPPAFLNKDFSVPLMTYAELLFILSEYKDFSTTEYKAGIEASLEYWATLCGSGMTATEKEAYITTVVTKGTTAETVAMQKYIDLYLNGMEAWTEIRRTGYPEQVLRPGEITVRLDEKDIRFIPLSEVKGDIISRVKYPTNESTLNGANWKEAVSRLTDGTNNYYSKMYWDVRTSTYSHPANK